MGRNNNTASCASPRSLLSPTTPDTNPGVQAVFAELAQVGFALASRDLQKSCKQLGCLLLMSIILMSMCFAVKMTKTGISLSFQLCADVSFALEVWAPGVLNQDHEVFCPTLIFLVLALTVLLQVLNINSYTPFHPCMLMFLSSVSSAQVRTSTQYLLTFYLQLSHIFGSDTWLLHT